MRNFSFLFYLIWNSYCLLFLSFLKLVSKNEYEKSRDELMEAPGPGKVSMLVIIFTSLEIKMNPLVMDHIQRNESLGIISAPSEHWAFFYFYFLYSLFLSSFTMLSLIAHIPLSLICESSYSGRPYKDIWVIYSHFSPFST